ncbi:MAG: twin-arginine translocation signal domain-containing protein, partial [Verrucomicrobia bacterium]|nr:twin-arginine translocation signal domain-containing protein [Verrucomicrobiota bacterium]
MTVPSSSLPSAVSRRDFLARCGMGMGTVGLAGLLPSVGAAESASPLAPKAPHFPGRAKRVIHFFLNGGPSHVDTFDP